jgi:gluconolactonase
MAWEFKSVTTNIDTQLGGIVWDGKALIVSAVEEGTLLRIDPANGHVERIRRFTSRTNALALGPGGKLYGAQEGSRRVVEFRSDGSTTVTAMTVDGKYHNHPSDLCVARNGNIWFSDARHPIAAFGPQIYPPLEHCSVLQLYHDRNHRWVIRRITDDTRAPRAILLSPDEDRLFVAEGEPKKGQVRELRSYRIVDGGVANHEVLMSFGSDHRGEHRGIEGMCLDADGNLVTCGGWFKSGPGPVISVVSPTGVVLESSPFPGDMPVKCTFGGAGLDTLFVTAAGGGVYRGNIGRKGYDRFAQSKPN